MKYLKFVNTFFKNKYSFAIGIFMLITALDGVIIPSFITNILDGISNRNNIFLLRTFYLGMFGFFIIRFSLYLWQHYQQKQILNFNLIIKNKLYKTFFENNHDLDSFNNILVNDIKIVEKNYISSLYTLIYCIAFSLVSAIYVLCINIKLASIFIVFSLFPLISSKIYSNKLENSTKLWSDASSNHLKKQTEYLSRKETIKLFNVSTVFLNKLNSLLSYSEKHYYCMNDTINRSRFLSNVLSGISSLLPLSIGAYFSIKGDISSSSLVGMFLASDRIISPLVNAVDYYNKMKSTYPLLEKVQSIVTNDERKTFRKKNSVLIDKILPIRLHNCQIKYDQHIVLDNISLVVNACNKILIIGKSGSGKTSLFNLIFHNISPSKGRIDYNNIDFKDMNTQSISLFIGYFTQKYIIFNETIKFNITLGENFTTEEISEVIKRVKLEYLLPTHSLDYVLDINNLSGGEMERIALARILIRKYSILLLDEFTAQLDKQTQDDIRNIIFSEYNTIIEISHTPPENTNIYTDIYEIKNHTLNKL